jgi:hypothetical protein
MDEESWSALDALQQRLRAQCIEILHAHQQTQAHVTHEPSAELGGGGGAEAPRDDDGLPGHRDDDEFYDEVADMSFVHIRERMLDIATRPSVPGEDDGDGNGILEQFYRAPTGDGRLLPAGPPPELDQQPYAYGGFGGVPACTEVIAGLAKQKYNRSAGEEEDDEECSICMMDYAVDDYQSVMPCKHRFHQKCLAGWLALSNFCPLCRHMLPPAEEQEVP